MTVQELSLGMLLHADPAFASGSTSFSSGLETLASDGWVHTGEDLSRLMVETVLGRWNSFDRVFLARSWASNSIDDLDRIDHEMEASMLGAAARLASRRAGAALLGTWHRLGQQAATAYRDRLSDAPYRGHLAVVQGSVYRSSGLSLAAAESLGCWAVLSAFASGAVRLGTVGHRVGQRALIEAQSRVVDALAIPVEEDAVPHAWTPVSDIAIERHSLSALRLFAS